MFALLAKNEGNIFQVYVNMLVYITFYNINGFLTNFEAGCVFIFKFYRLYTYIFGNLFVFCLIIKNLLLKVLVISSLFLVLLVVI